MQQGQLSITKISRPRISGVLPRERLFRLLDQGGERPVTWIHGPGGSGKSTLVAGYLDCRGLPCLWYQMDAGDADLATFFYYLGLAVKKAQPRRRRPLPLFTAEFQADIAIFARRYFETLFSRFTAPFLLVLDDYHELPENSPLHEVIKHAVAQAPPGIRIVVLSRKAPPAVMARLCAGRQLSFVDWEALRLTAQETAEIVRLHDPDARWGEVLEPLHERLQGWVAGLVLALERGKVEELGQWLSGRGSQEDIFNYFAEELFNKTAPEIRDFLLKTALLPTIVPALAQRLADNPEAARILEELHAAHFFTEKRFEGEVLYRFHPLFREYLLAKGAGTYPPQRLADLKKSAAALLEEEGKVDEAALLRADAGDWEGLGGLILKQAMTMIGQGRSQTVLEWLGRIPAEVVEGAPYLLFWWGAALFAADPAESRARFRRAFTVFREQGDRSGLFLSWCAVVDTAIQASEYTLMREWVEVLDRVLAERPDFPSREIEVRVALAHFNALAFALPGSPRLHAVREAAFSLVGTEKIADGNLFLTTCLHLSIHFMYQGDFARAGVVLNLLKEAARQKEASDLVQITVQVTEAHYAFATGSPDACLATAFEALALARKSGVHLWDMHVYGHAASAALSKGDQKVAAELLSSMSSGLTACRRVDKGYYYWLKAWQLALGGSFAEALQFLELARELAQGIGFVAPELAITISCAQLRIELGLWAEAELELEEVLPPLRETGSAYLFLYYFLTQALLYFRQGEHDGGVEALGRALALGRSHRIVNFFFWRCDLMAELCARALEAGVEAEFANSLAQSRGLRLPSPKSFLEAWPWPLKLYTLGRFELVKDGVPLEFSGKVQKKPLEMLKILVALGGREASAGQIADLMWPEVDGDTARNSFKVTLHRLREMLGAEKALQVQEGRLVMDRSFFWTDAWAFEQLLTAAQLKGEEGEEGEAIRLARKGLELYQGMFLVQDLDRPWAVSLRKRLHDRFVLNVVLLGKMVERHGDHQQVISCYLQGLVVDELEEQFYQNLMKSYLEAGLRADAVRVYRRCQKTLAAGLGISPSERTTSLYRIAAGEA